MYTDHVLHQGGLFNEPGPSTQCPQVIAVTLGCFVFSAVVRSTVAVVRSTVPLPMPLQGSLSELTVSQRMMSTLMTLEFLDTKLAKKMKVRR